jgi:enoyl-CoA hydratase
MPQYENWLLSEDDHIATLTLNRPATNNNLSIATLAELRSATAWLAASKDVWAVILQGSGPHFSAGMDTSVFLDILNQSELVFRKEVLDMQLALDDFEALQKPTIARLQGYCIGGGLLLALACDFRIASLRTMFALPEIKIGIAPMWGTQRVTRTIGLAATKEVVLLGERFSAQKALDMGLVNQAVAPDQLDAAVNALAEKFRKLPPRTTGMVKHILNSGYHYSLRQNQQMELDAQAALFNSPDLREAVESYVNQREPHFKGE